MVPSRACQVALNFNFLKKNRRRLVTGRSCNDCDHSKVLEVKQRKGYELNILYRNRTLFFFSVHF